MIIYANLNRYLNIHDNKPHNNSEVFYKLVLNKLPSYSNTYFFIFHNENMHDHSYTLQLDEHPLICLQ